MKLTLQKFYRINGGSTQLKGVAPDIVIPDQFEYLKYREKDNPDALPWDEIQKASFNPAKTWYSGSAVKQMSGERINSNPQFMAIKETVAKLEKMNDKVYSLNMAKYRAEQKEIKAAIRKIEEVNKSMPQELNLSLLPNDEKKLAADTDKLERRKQWMKSLSKDIYLDESVKVMDDMIKQTAIAKAK